MMGSTTRRISEKELQRLKEIQRDLEAKGIKLSQVELGEVISEYLLENYNDFVKLVMDIYGLQEENSHIIRLLHEPVDGKEETDVVSEHDVII